MSVAQITVALDEELLRRVDAWVGERCFESRDDAIERALAEKLGRLEKRRGTLEEALKYVDPAEEQRLAEEGMAADAAEWPAS